MAHQVFISYSHLDNQIAHALCDKLEADGTKCWIAPRDIAPGKSWAGEIASAIPKSKIMILILSKSADSSSQVLREVEIAVHHKLIIIPVRIEDIMPTGGMSYYLATMQWIDVKGDKIDSKLAMISKKVRNILSELEDDEETDEDIQADIKVDIKDETVPSKRKRGRKTVWIIIIAVVLAAAAGVTLFLMRDTLFKREDAEGTASSTQTLDVTAETTATLTPAPTSTDTSTLTANPTGAPAPTGLYISDLSLTAKSATTLFVSWNELDNNANSYMHYSTISYRPVDEEEYQSATTILAHKMLYSLLPNTEYLVKVSTEDGYTISDTIVMPTPTPTVTITPIPTPTPRSEYIPEDFDFDADTEVDIPDDTLKDAIYTTLEGVGKKPEGELTIADMFNLKYLFIAHPNYTDLLDQIYNSGYFKRDSIQVSTDQFMKTIEGLQYAKNLKALVIIRNRISDLSPLSELYELKMMFLDGESIRSFDPLAGLTNLEFLVIDESKYIRDIGALGNLENLTNLGVTWSELTDISAIMNLSNIIDLGINNSSRLNDLSYLQDSPLIKNLSGLWIQGCNVSDLSFLSEARKLRVLCLSDQSASSYNEDISVLADLHLDELYVSTRTYTDNIETIAKLLSKGCNVSIDE